MSGRMGLALLLGLCLIPAARANAREAVDHVILTAPDLNQAIDEFEQRTGVRPALGGVHPGRGTQNALASLGKGTYLEILAPSGEADSSVSRSLRERPMLTPDGWAVGTSGATSLRRRLRASRLSVTALEPGSRLRPDGVKLAWTTFGLAGPENVSEPFFIAWADMSAHPSVSAPQGCTLKSMSAEARRPARLSSLVRLLGLDVQVRKAPNDRVRLILACPKGEVAF